MNENKLRGTGRTTRMLEHAKQLAREGRAVYVIADNTRAMSNLRYQCGTNLGIKFETPETLAGFDWQTMELRGANSNCVVLVDHFAIERRFARILEMVHAYDEQMSEVAP